MDGNTSNIGNISGSLSPPSNISGELSIPTYVDVDVYDGITEVTPTTEQQVLQTYNKTVTRNIVVNPIPEDYGRLLYSGHTLTVY